MRSAAGSGRYGSEYLVASKKIGPVDLSLGTGTGRLVGPFAVDNPLKFIGGRFDKPVTRTDQDIGPDKWGRGNKIGFFGGIRLDLPTPTPLDLVIESGGDRDARERSINPGQDRPQNFAIGLDWRPDDDWQIGVGWDGRDQIMGRVAVRLDPLWRRPARPVSPRPLQPTLASPLVEPVSRLELFGLDQPPPISNFAADAKKDHTIIVTQAGVPMRGVVIPRQKPGLPVSPEENWHRAQIQPRNQPLDMPPPPWDQRLKLAIMPTIDLDVFEASTTAIQRQSLVMTADAMLGTGLIGGAGMRINGDNNLDDLARDRATSLLPVRSDLGDYAKHRAWLERLYIGQIYHPLPDFYGLLYGGFLEENYAATGGDLLYAPDGKRWDIEMSLAAAQKRAPDEPLKILGQPGNGVWRLSGGYDFPDQQTKLVVGAGRFLAGDLGIKTTLAKQWPSGMIAESWLAWSNANQLPQLAEYGGADFGLRLRWPLAVATSPLITVEPRLNIRPLGRDGVQDLEKPLSLRDLRKPALIGPP